MENNDQGPFVLVNFNKLRRIRELSELRGQLRTELNRYKYDSKGWKACDQKYEDASFELETIIGLLTHTFDSGK